MREAIAAGVLALAGGLALYPAFLGMVARHRGGQRVAIYGPESHALKEGTATMGGLLFCALAVAAWLILDRSRTGYVGVFALAAGAAVGLLDDLANTRGKGALGLLARQKLLLQVVVGALVGVGLHEAGVSRQLVPGLGVQDAGWWVVAVAVVAVVAASNATNLTDGVDGLAATCGLIAFAGTALMGLHEHSTPATVLSAALVGGLAAFLVFNWFPARVFMGDTGSLAIGCALVVVTAQLGLLWLLPLLGIVFVLETLSVIVNVTAITRLDRRVLRASPLHHHLELVGMREPALVLLFALVACAGAALTVAYGVRVL